MLVRTGSKALTMNLIARDVSERLADRPGLLAPQEIGLLRRSAIQVPPPAITTFGSRQNRLTAHH
jgi:hypothetical protein